MAWRFAMVAWRAVEEEYKKIEKIMSAFVAGRKKPDWPSHLEILLQCCWVFFNSWLCCSQEFHPAFFLHNQIHQENHSAYQKLSQKMFGGKTKQSQTGFEVKWGLPEYKFPTEFPKETKKKKIKHKQKETGRSKNLKIPEPKPIGWWRSTLWGSFLRRERAPSFCFPLRVKGDPIRRSNVGTCQWLV